MSKKVKTKQGVPDLNALFGGKQVNGKKSYMAQHLCYQNAERFQNGRGAWEERCSVCQEPLGSGSELD